MPSDVRYNVQSPLRPPARRRRQLPSTPPPEQPASDVYILSDGVRPRLVPADAEQPAPLRSEVPNTQPSTELAELAEPPQHYRMEPAAASQPGGSMVDVVDDNQQEAVWRGDDVSVLSEQSQDKKEWNQQQHALVVRFSDLQVTKFCVRVHLLSIQSALKSVDCTFGLFTLLFYCVYLNAVQMSRIYNAMYKSNCMYNNCCRRRLCLL